MKSLSKIVMVIAVLLSSVNSFAQIKNAKTETVKIYGNCGMCETTIENAGNVKKVAQVDWNKDTKMATLTYDGDKTNQDEILKRIALAGYDSEKFRAPDDVYAKLAECCQYDRPIKTVAKNKDAGMNMSAGHGDHNHSEMTASANKGTAQNQSQLKAVFDNYFSVKDALIKTDAATASAKAAELAASLKAVDMNKLSAEEHTAWMKVMQDLTANAESISKSKDVAKQRSAFAALSEGIYTLAKVSKQDTPVYYQHCPMYNGGKGANWLSKENEVKNPYYGSQMLTCGSTVETIK
ncbi:MAG: mercury transporter [Saprospirales bacterium]|nr:mercury transporter [Saprospirales bacterium]